MGPATNAFTVAAGGTFRASPRFDVNSWSHQSTSDYNGADLVGIGLTAALVGAPVVVIGCAVITEGVCAAFLVASEAGEEVVSAGALEGGELFTGAAEGADLAPF